MRLCALMAIVTLTVLGSAGDHDDPVSLGWSRYRAGDFAGAKLAFAAAGDGVGLAYVDLQTLGPGPAAARFEAVLAREPGDEDALRGLVLAARRTEADDDVRRKGLAAARTLAERRPDDRDLRMDVLALEAATGGATERRPRTQAGSTPIQVSVRVGSDYLEVRTASGWQPIFVKGVNLGLALPGRWPSEFPQDPGLYAGWLDQIAAMGANSVRAYTLLPPVFYRVLAEHNAAGKPRLWLVQGVWTELPEGHDFGRAEAIANFEAEIARVIDAVHGNLELAPRPGHAAGIYDTDASSSLLAYVIGREWEPFAVKDYLARARGRRDWQGTWLRVRQGNAMERWVAARCDFAAGYEAKQYRTLHPVTFANWPTLDPLSHPTESDRAQEDRWRKRLGLPAFAPVEQSWDNDTVEIDAARIEPTRAMEAGFFASYHIYPNYPDFLNLEPAYGGTTEGRYDAYLRALKAHHAKQAVLVAEFGMSTSRGIAHVQLEGLHHGGISEEQQGRIEAVLLSRIHDARYAGGIVFSWLDEWWKATWSVARLEVPAERRRLWLNVESPEQNYGLIAARPASLQLELDGKGDDWLGPDGPLQAAADEAFLWIKADAPHAGSFRLAIDTYAAERGERVLPRPGPVEVDSGVEFLVDIGPGGSRITVTEPYEPYARLDGGDLASPLEPTGRFVPLFVETNRERIARDGRRFPAEVIERGLLKEGVDYVLGDGVLELRIPWTLLNVSDPSSRRVLHQVGARGDELGTTVTDGFRLYAFTSDPSRPEAPPISTVGPVEFTWPGWEEPRYRLEPKAGLATLSAKMQGLEPIR